MSARVDMIRQRLQALTPSKLDIEDQSHLHIGHAGAKSGKGHFVVVIVSEQFAGKTLVQRHRMVYGALGDAMETDIHALSVKALTSSEVSS